MTAAARRYSVGDRFIARIPNRKLHPPGDPDAYVRSGATGTIADLRPGTSPDEDRITVEFDDLGVIDWARAPGHCSPAHCVEARGPPVERPARARARRRSLGVTTGIASTPAIPPQETRGVQLGRPPCTRAPGAALAAGGRCYVAAPWTASCLGGPYGCL
jgi:hypothetical protein